MAGTTKVTRRVGMIAAAALLAAGVGGAAVAQAQQAPDPSGPCARLGRWSSGGGDREHIARKFMRRLKDRVGLSDQQAEDLRATLKASRDEARPDVQALCEARVDMRRLLDDRNSDPTAIKAAGDKVKALQGKLLDRRVDATVALRAKLTAEQWTKWVELRKEMARRFWHRRFHHWRHHHRRHHHDRERD